MHDAMVFYFFILLDRNRQVPVPRPEGPVTICDFPVQLSVDFISNQLNRVRPAVRRCDGSFFLPQIRDFCDLLYISL